MKADVFFTVFTKPWKLALHELGEHVSKLGFEGVELPVRPGYAVNPDNVAGELARAVTVLGEFGLKIASIAGTTDEKTIAACGEAGVPVIRVCLVPKADEHYLDFEKRIRGEYDRLVPALERHRVTIGVQNHCDRCLANAMGLLHLLDKYDKRHVAAVWDAAHNALAGEVPDLALDIIWPRLCMVNLKNAYWRRTSGPEAPFAQWQHYWTTGRHGLANWPTVIGELKKRGYSGPVCLTAEYSDHEATDRLAVEDLALAKELFGV